MGFGGFDLRLRLGDCCCGLAEVLFLPLGFLVWWRFLIERVFFMIWAGMGERLRIGGVSGRWRVVVVSTRFGFEILTGVVYEGAGIALVKEGILW